MVMTLGGMGCAKPMITDYQARNRCCLGNRCCVHKVRTDQTSSSRYRPAGRRRRLRSYAFRAARGQAIAALIGRAPAPPRDVSRRVRDSARRRCDRRGVGAVVSGISRVKLVKTSPKPAIMAGMRSLPGASHSLGKLEGCRPAEAVSLPRAFGKRQLDYRGGGARRSHRRPKWQRSGASPFASSRA